MRNGFFHKDNIENWDNIVDVRKTAQLVYYIILGAYALSEDDKVKLGLIQVKAHDEYYKLCAYINQLAYNSNALIHPIIYINDEVGSTIHPYSFGIPYQDECIIYDNYGDPIYSGFYIKEFGKGGKVYKFTKEDIPMEIWEGTLEISRSVPITITPSGAKRRVFFNGKFVADEV